MAREKKVLSRARQGLRGEQARARPISGPIEPSKKPIKMLYTADRSMWRRWLRKHYRTEREVWLVYFKRASGKPRISYNDAVEEALCFGWIDSTVRRLDNNRFAQRFTPRKPGSQYSQANRERLRRLAAHGNVVREVLPALLEFRDEPFRIPADILEAIRASRVAWKNFQKFSEAYKRIRIAFIEGARDRPPEFAKRLRYFVGMTEKNRQYGFGGIDKYY